MKNCPACGKSKVSFDEALTKFHCSACDWMNVSANERPVPEFRHDYEQDGVEVSSYAFGKDLAIFFEGEVGESAFDIPEPSGNVWRVSCKRFIPLGLIVYNRNPKLPELCDFSMRRQAVELAVSSSPATKQSLLPGDITLKKVDSFFFGLEKEGRLPSVVQELVLRILKEEGAG